MAAPLAANPHELVAPDFASEPYAPQRQVLIDAGQTAEQATALLRDVWIAENNRARQLWDAHVQAEEAAAAAAEEARLHQLELEQAAAEEARKEEEKKRVKLPAIDRAIHPLIQLRSPISPYASSVLRSMKRLDLWYCTPEGLRFSRKSTLSRSDQSFAIVNSSSGLALAPSSAHKPSRYCIPDHLLSWQAFTASHAVLCSEMRSHGWSPQHADMFRAFFYHLVSHETWRTRTHGDAAILLYQERARAHWHHHVETNNTAYDLSILSEPLFDECYRTVKEDVESRVIPAPSLPMDTSTSNSSRRSRHRAPSPAQHSLPLKPLRSFSKRDRSASPIRGQNQSFPERLLHSACAVCLGRHPHDLSHCASALLWTGRPAYCKRDNAGRILTPDGRELCLEWQRPRGCPSKSPGHLHLCSGCGNSSHGAFSCSLAQTSQPSDASTG